MSKTPREDVVHELALCGIAAFRAAEVSDLSVAEVVSASFTMTSYIIDKVLTYSDPEEYEHNKMVITAAIAVLNQKLNPTLN